jgi:hypothetical protein
MPRVRLSRPPSASTPRSSASAHGLPSPGERRDLRTVPDSWATGESRGLDSDLPRRMLERALQPQPPPPPPAPDGGVRCRRRAGLPWTVVCICKEKCAITELRESVALNSLVPYDMKHPIRVCENKRQSVTSLCVFKTKSPYIDVENLYPIFRGIQRQAPTTLALSLSCNLRSLPHNGVSKGGLGKVEGKGRGEVGPESTIRHTGYGLNGHDLPFLDWGMMKQSLVPLASHSPEETRVMILAWMHVYLDS